MTPKPANIPTALATSGRRVLRDLLRQNRAFVAHNQRDFSHMVSAAFHPALVPVLPHDDAQCHVSSDEKSQGACFEVIEASSVNMRRDDLAADYFANAVALGRL